MQAYPEVPRLWYAAIAAIAFTFLSISIYLFPTQLPFWGLLIAVLISAALSIPLALIQAISNQQISFSVMHELIAGYILPGRPVANMIFKCVALMGVSGHVYHDVLYLTLFNNRQLRQHSLQAT